MSVLSEHLEQVYFIQYFKRTYPDVLIFAIPNGGKRNLSEAARLKAEGVVAGVPDLCIPAWRIYIEMKRSAGGVVSKEQQSMIKYLQSVDYDVIVGHGKDDAIKKLNGVLNAKK